MTKLNFMTKLKFYRTSCQSLWVPKARFPIDKPTPTCYNEFILTEMSIDDRLGGFHKMQEQDKLEKYKIGTISDIMRIPIETLRFYESKGLITPKRDENSKYRYYDVNDIGNLMEYKRLRAMEISGKDTLESMEEDTLKTFIVRMEEKQEEYSKRREEYARLELFQQEYFRRLNSIPKFLYRFTIVTAPEIYYLCMRNAYQFAPKEGLGELMEQWLSYIPFVEQFYRIPEESIEQEDYVKLRMGICIEKEWATRLSFPTTIEHVRYAPAQMAVKTVIAFSGDRLPRSVLSEGLEYIRNHKFILNGDILGRTLAHVHDADGKMLHYVELFYPIKE